MTAPALRRSVGTVVAILVIVVGTLAAAATVFGFLGQLWWGFDVASSFRPQYAVVLLLASLVFALISERVAAIVVLAAAVANLIVIMPLFTGSPAERRTGAADELLIVTFNVQAGNTHRSEVVSWLATTGADLVFLHESSADWENAVMRGGADFDIISSPPLDRTFGTTVLATIPATAQIRYLGPDDAPVPVVSVDLDGEPITIFAVHVPSPNDRESTRSRDDLMDAVARDAAATAGSVVVAGDLNATPWSHAFRQLVSKADLDNSLSGYGLQPTWPAGVPALAVPIDHVLHSDDLTTVRRVTGPNLGSDHRPVIATITLAAQ